MRPILRGLGPICVAAALLVSSPSTAQMAAEGPTQNYKGITLVGTAYKDHSNRAFFEQIKFAIDMVEGLPEADWNQTKLIKRIVYDPPSKFRKKNDVYTNIVGVYLIGDWKEWPAPIVIYKDMKYASALDVALSIVGNAMQAERHQTLAINLKTIQDIKGGKTPNNKTKLAAAKKEASRILRIVNKSAPPDELLADDCRFRIAIYEAHKELFPDKRKLDAMSRELNRHGCF